MSKQVNHVNIEPEILHGNWSSYWKYNSFVNPFTSCKTDIIIYIILQTIPMRMRIRYHALLSTSKQTWPLNRNAGLIGT